MPGVDFRVAAGCEASPGAVNPANREEASMTTATYDPELERLAHPDELLPRLETPAEHDDDGDDEEGQEELPAPDTYEGDDEGDSGSDEEPAGGD